MYSLRGIGKDVFAIFADEFFFFSPDVLPAILPTLATGAVFIMTSSVSPDGDNPMMRMIDTRYNDGTPVVKQLDFNKSCNACKRKGLQKRCPHIKSILTAGIMHSVVYLFPLLILSLIERVQSIGERIRQKMEDGERLTMIEQPQHFQSHAGNERMEKLMDPKAYRVEIENEEELPSISNAFQKEWIDSMEKNTYKLKKHVDHIFITIDPSAGKRDNPQNPRYSPVREKSKSLCTSVHHFC